MLDMSGKQHGRPEYTASVPLCLPKASPRDLSGQMATP